MEAEAATLYGSSEIEENESASGGAHVGYIDRDGAGVRFTITQSRDVIYLRYASENSGNINIYINGIKQGTIYLEESGSYMYDYSIVAITGLNLTENSTLAFQYDSYMENVAANIDFIAYNLSDTQMVTDVALQTVQTN